MSAQLLQIKDLSVKVEDKEILHNVDLNLNKGETHVLMGPNGAGKSTLGYALMGNPRYEITDGHIFFNGKDITEESPAERARDGIFLSFQNPIEVPGITLGNFIRTALEQRTGSRIRLWNFRKELKKAMDILQLLMLKPSLAILDETDSGLDVDAVRTVSRGVEEYQKNKNGALLIITHSTRILEALHVDATHILAGGKMVASGDSSLVDEINTNGFEKYIQQ